ncbi:MAG TPA: pyridoxamine 5'-phosphate oxidase [Pyrinomonadaceae bacterium]|jgi:pyridoxamine 5'-phosphate oxidase|nr:pyridoxamine 5'-phosphate oxidase [Pyrinomonadaceae bacterium]
MDRQELADLRREYLRETLDKSSVDADPFVQFAKWMNEALASEIIDATAMVLSTVDPENRPSSRVVLLKGFDKRGFRFFTNYQSKKSRELNANPHVAIHFFWAELERQINIRGRVEKTSTEESEEYFRTRPLESRLGAWASNQSEVVASREELEHKLVEMRLRFADGNVPLPPFWGGFRLIPDRFEFWQGRPSRLHDRICYELSSGGWVISRLSP